MVGHAEEDLYDAVLKYVGRFAAGDLQELVRCNGLEIPGVNHGLRKLRYHLAGYTSVRGSAGSSPAPRAVIFKFVEQIVALQRYIQTFHLCK